MDNAYQPPEGNDSRMASPVEPESEWREERFAALLLRLLGVYFTASVLMTGSEEVVRLFFAISETSVDQALSAHAYYLFSLTAQLAIGLYLFLGGRWVLEKVLMPIAGASSEEQAPDVEPATGDSPRTTPE